ncbi:MAG: hypothetical protein ACKVQR_23275 [Aquabacterium sp.]
MISNSSSPLTAQLIGQASASAEHAIDATQRITNVALDSLSGSVQDMRDRAIPAVNRTSDAIGALVQQGLDRARDGRQMLSDRAHRATDATTGYIKGEPIKAMLIAAATGAVLMALVSQLARSRDPR